MRLLQINGWASVRLMIALSVFTVTTCISAFGQATAARESDQGSQRTWTYTYLKAKDGQRENLKGFIIANWFAMDSIAVRQGLFNDYQLLANTADPEAADWDYIVAVEYFTAGTYADIQEEWAPIRSNHEKVLVNGYDFPDLGEIVKSGELLRVAPTLRECTGERYDILAPFLGEWHEYLLEDGAEKLYGKLSINIDPNTCSLTKDFTLYTNPFYYTTLAYFDADEAAWIETYSFSNGGYARYKWKQEGSDFLLERQESSFPSDYQNRNRWTNISANAFQILEERSYDGGRTWQVYSTTQLKRIGGGA